MTRASVVALALLVALSTSTPALAATPVAFGEMTRLIHRGDTVVVADWSGTSVSGKLLTLTPDTLAITADGVRHDFTAADVARVERRHRMAKRGAIIGVIGGAAVGVAGLIACGILCTSNGGGEIVGVAFFGGLGAGIGAGIGAAFHGVEVVYLAPAVKRSSRLGMPVPPSREVAVRWTRAF